MVIVVTLSENVFYFLIIKHKSLYVVLRQYVYNSNLTGININNAQIEWSQKGLCK